MKRMIIVLGGLVIAAGLILVLMTYHANEDVELPGYMEADLVLVGSEQGGRIAELSVEEGNSVKQDDPIFVLESSEQEASVAAALGRVSAGGRGRGTRTCAFPDRVIRCPRMQSAYTNSRMSGIGRRFHLMKILSVLSFLAVLLGNLQDP